MKPGTYRLEYPVLCIPDTARFLNVTHRSGAQLIGKLVGAGILTEMTGRERYRLYAAREIMDTFESSNIQKTENSDLISNRKPNQ